MLRYDKAEAHYSSAGWGPRRPFKLGAGGESGRRGCSAAGRLYSLTLVQLTDTSRRPPGRAATLKLPTLIGARRPDPSLGVATAGVGVDLFASHCMTWQAP